jgi:DNA-binding LytR/AlgR family response regulator
MNIRIYIVDDEAPARRELKYLLEKTGGVEVIGEAANSSIALTEISELMPQLVFLDIQMPGINGLELARTLGPLPEKPLIIFSTAFDKYAAQAFDVEAVDFLCKPFTLERVARAVTKAAKMIAMQAPGYAAQASETGNQCRRIPLSKGGAIVPTSSERIVFIRSEEGEVAVHVDDGIYRTRFTLNELEQKLAGVGFVRTHRSYLVNINRVRDVARWFSGGYKLTMDDRDHSIVPVSRYNARDLKMLLDL